MRTINPKVMSSCNLITCPSLQEKMRQEIKEKGSRERDQLPYCMAVIMETLRYIPLIGLGAPRWTWEDIVVDGYKIPTGMLGLTMYVCCVPNSITWPMI